MAWRDLRADIADLFSDDRVNDAEIDAWNRARLPPPQARDPKPHTCRGRILGAIRGGARRSRDIARVTGIDVTDVRIHLNGMRRRGLVTLTPEGLFPSC